MKQIFLVFKLYVYNSTKKHLNITSFLVDAEGIKIAENIAPFISDRKRKIYQNQYLLTQELPTEITNSKITRISLSINVWVNWDVDFFYCYYYYDFHFICLFAFVIICLHYQLDICLG